MCICINITEMAILAIFFSILLLINVVQVELYYVRTLIYPLILSKCNFHVVNLYAG